MNPILNRPHDQYKQSIAIYDHIHNDKAQDSPIKGIATFHDPEGMSIPWGIWEEAVKILLENHSLQELLTKDISRFAAMDEQYVVEPNPNPSSTEDLEYEIATATKFRFRLHQDQTDSVPRVLGECFLFEETLQDGKLNLDASTGPLATVQVRMDLPNTPEMTELLKEMLADPGCRKSMAISMRN